MRSRGPTPPWPARVIHALLVRTYPVGVRGRFGGEMRQFFVDSYAEAQAKRRRLYIVKFYLRSFSDVATNSLRARLDRQRAGAVHSASAPSPRERGYAPNKGGFTETVGNATRSIHHSLRGLARTPGFSIVVLITLGLGIGASTTIFSVVDGILISSLPYPEAENLVVLRERSPLPEGREGWVSEPTFRDWRERTTAFEDIVAWRLNLATLTGGDTPERIQGYVVSAGFFPTMGIEMTMGRGFSEDEDRLGANKVVVISRNLWQRRFGGDPEILGRSLVMDGESYTIIGVAGTRLSYPGDADMWSPIALEYEPTFRGFRYLGLIGRIRSGISQTDARMDLERVAGALEGEFQETNAGWGASISTLKSMVVGGLEPVLLGMMVAVSLLFVIAVGNVANLFVARLMDRQTEVAIRRALGASRASLARLFVTEAFVLSLLGCAVGIGVAIWGTRALGVLARGRLPRLDEVGVDGRVLLFAVLSAMVVTLILGVFPTLAVARSRIGGTLQAGSRAVTGQAKVNRLRELVVTTQVALAITLLVGASLLAKSLWNLHKVDPGFDQTNVVTTELNLPDSRYDSDRLMAVLPELLGRIGDLPGVEAVGTIHPMPMVLGSVPSRYAVQSADQAANGVTPMAHPRIASPGYFKTMGIPLLNGRFLDDTDRFGGLPVAVVNQTFANRYLTSSNPVGQQITWQDPSDPDAVWQTVVGVVGDVLFRGLGMAAEPEVYTSVLQQPYGFGQLVVRHQGNPEQLTSQIATAFREIDPELGVGSPLTAESIISRSMGAARLNTTLTSVFAAVAGVLAIVGVLGVLTLLVKRRMREIGIRMVLGAPPRQVLGFVLTKGMRPVVIGVVLGIAASAVLTRFLESQVYGTSTLDPLAFLLPSFCFLIAAFVACQWPAKRATRMDPASVLRAE